MKSSFLKILSEVVIYTEIKDILTFKALKSMVPNNMQRLEDYDVTGLLEEPDRKPLYIGIENGYLIAMRKDDFDYILSDNEDGTITHRLYREVDNITFLTMLRYAFYFSPEK